MRGPRLASAALLGCLVLTACQGDPVGPVDPNDTATPTTASPTPTGPTPPAMPEAAKVNSARGAIAFVSYYVSLMNYGASTGRTAEIRAASSECSTCSRYIATYEKLRRDGGFSEDPGWVSNATISQRTEADTYRVLTTVQTKQFKYRSSRNDEVKQVQSTSYDLIFDVRMTGTDFATILIDEQVEVG